jgi:hypothetical protein
MHPFYDFMDRAELRKLRQTAERRAAMLRVRTA